MGDTKLTLETLFRQGPRLAGPSLSALGSTLIIAPHPDDESLACGGTIALLRKFQYPVSVIFITDGAMSHPNSKQYPPERLRALREQEALEALLNLGVPAGAVSFLRLPDSRLNALSREDFQAAATRIRARLLQFQPQTILLPWRSDPHPDHMESWRLVQACLKDMDAGDCMPPMILEYLLWFWDRTNLSELDSCVSTAVWKVEIAEVLAEKKKAIRAHKSQLGRLIKDDPEGFVLPKSLLKKLQTKEEVFLRYDDATHMTFNHMSASGMFR